MTTGAAELLLAFGTLPLLKIAVKPKSVIETNNSLIKVIFFMNLSSFRALLD
jgi:hypothetical protein